MPTKYRMVSIESIADFISGQPANLDLERFKSNVEKYKRTYCQHLKDTTGQVEDCKELSDCEFILPGSIRIFKEIKLLYML